MSYASIEPASAALVFFDTLNYGFANPPDDHRDRVEAVKANWVRLAEAARSHGVPLVFPMADHRPDGADTERRYTDVNHDMQPWPDPEVRFRPHTANTSGSWGAQVIDELSPRPEDYLIPKHRWSAFFQTHLELSLRSRGANTIILCGGATEIGIASTAYAARDLDFDLVIVRDATTSRRQHVHDLFVNDVFPRFARVRTTDQVVAMLDAGADSPQS
ncbi:MAG TPA: isochorismatase family cysteine hydrolase [Candidatus Limnocylindria bacterium]|nr:isochorismatase family cysteine hydrolase [Candidatus Limnocylindria bacterium]